MRQNAPSLGGRLAGWLFLASGFVTVANNYLPGSEHLDKAVLNLLGVCAIGLGALSFARPWHRWPARLPWPSCPSPSP